MKKNNTAKESPKALANGKKKVREVAAKQRLTIGLDLGDRSSRYCILDEAGEKVSEGSLPTTEAGLSGLFAKMPASRIALEVGTHSPWVSRHLKGMGHEAIVANSHKVKLNTQSVHKNDRIDAEQLARLARVDPKLLSPIQHRGPEAQADLAVMRARGELMEARTALINCARGLVKPMGERLKKCDADQVDEDLGKGVSEAARTVIGPLLKSVEAISQQIGEYDQRIAEIAKRYPEVELLTPIYGVGELIGLAYILTVEDPGRFAHSRDVGPYLGLKPKERDSGDSHPQLGITKAGDGFLRTLLVQGAHCVLRKGAPESDLRTWGLAKMKSGGKNAKKRAIVAVARKLAVLMHALWSAGEVYDPQYNQKARQAAAQGKGKVAA
jgi:transposase